MSKATPSTTLHFFVISAAFIILVAGMRSAADMLVPFLLAIFISIIATPPLHWLQNKNLPRWLAMLTVITGIIGCSSLMIALVGSSITDFSQSLPEYKARLKNETQGIIILLNNYGIKTPSQLIQEYINPGAAMDLVSKLFSSLSNTLANAFLILLTVIFILSETSSFPKKLDIAFDNAHSHMQSFKHFISNIKQYVAIKSIMSATTGIIISLWLWILDIDYPLLWGLLAFLFNYLPNIGSIIAAVPAILLAFVQNGMFIALLSTGGYIVTNVIISNIIEPRFLGKGLGLSTLVVFISLFFWGWVFGPIGMLLSVPLTMLVKIALNSSDESRWLSILMDSKTSI